jgi:hypothetical protein
MTDTAMTAAFVAAATLTAIVGDWQRVAALLLLACMVVVVPAVVARINQL